MKKFALKTGMGWLGVMLALVLLACSPKEEEPVAHDAAAYGDASQVIFYLEEGGDPNAKDADEVPLLVNSLGPKGSDEAAQLLLEKGANPNSQDGTGRTPLMEAALRGRVELVKQLLEKNADPNLVDQQGYTALMCVNAKNPEDVEAIVKLLIEKGADVNAQAIDGNTPLKHALDLKLPGMIQALRAAGAQ